MTTVTVTRNVVAPPIKVFNVIADPQHFASALSGATEVEFHFTATRGAGTRFRQTRELSGKETTMEF